MIWTSIAVRASLLLGALCFCSAVDPAGSFEQLCNDFFREYVSLKPETGTQLGLPAGSGIPIRNDLLDDISPAAIDKVYQLYRKYDALISQCDRGKLDARQKISYDIFKWFLNLELQMEKYRYHDYVVNPMFGFHNELTTLMTEHHRISNLKDAKDYIARLKQYDKRLSQVEEQMKIREIKGLIPPVYIVEQTEDALNDFTSVTADSNILYTSFVTRVNGLQDLDQSTKDDLIQEALRAVRDIVYPSYKKISLKVFNLKYKTDSIAGVWKLKDGDNYYQCCLLRHTTLVIPADEIHNIGLSEVKRIIDMLNMLYDSVGVPSCSTLKERHSQYWRLTNRDNSDLLYPDGEEGKVQTLRDYQQIIDDMSMHLPEMFTLIPRSAVRVERVPLFKEQTVGTYYQQPKLDGSTGGIFYANLSYKHFKPGMKALTYHEAIPGHHLQIALEYESSPANLFRTLFFFTGFIEGWALYAERLADEQGFYEDIHSHIGYLRSELFRAARLVVDTGIHSKKWTREQAYNYMQEIVGWPGYGEIDRYIVWPGQACAYKIGELKILELREKTRRELGDRFDIKVFHQAVLQYGSMPLDILERVVEKYIAETK